MEDAFFAAFNEDLRNREAWQEFHTTYKKGKGKLKDTAAQNPSLLGDPVSLKAANAESDKDRGAGTDVGAHKRPVDKEKEAKRPERKGKLKDAATKNPSLLGDPVSIKSDNAETKTTDQDGGAQSSSYTASNAKASNRELSIPPEAPAPTVTSLTSAKPYTKASSSPNPSPTSSTPALPSLPAIDGKALFWQMMDHSRTPDPYIFPALLRLKSAPASQRPVLGALSNTVIFPPGHPYNRLPSVPASSGSTPTSPSSSPASKSSVSKDDDPRSYFDVFISSAEVGLRKPDRKIYELAVKKLDEFDRQKGGTGIKAEDILFLDDIGENLKTAREMGMRTIKVLMGKTFRAVKELEGVTGLELMDEKMRRAKL